MGYVTAFGIILHIGFARWKYIWNQKIIYTFITFIFWNFTALILSK